jgi:predicted Zn-dependent protease
MLFSCAAAASMGCTASTGSTTSVDRWVWRQGGTVDGAPQARAERALASLGVQTSQGSLTIRVLASPELAAFSWRTGELFVTRGLLDRVNDEELMAAIAHEVGHLIADGHVASPAALGGQPADPDAEVRADLLACELLARSGRPSSALINLLKALATEKQLDVASRQHQNDRIARVGLRQSTAHSHRPGQP